MANPRKFSEKIALHNQKQAEETAAFEEIMKEVSAATNKPEETNLAIQYGMGCSPGRSNVSPSRSPGPRGRASSSVGPMRNRPAERKHDTSPYGSTVYLSPPPDSSWRRTNSDSALHQSCNEQPPSPALSPHHPHHSHAHPHHVQHHHHRRSESDYSPTDYRNWNDTSQRTPDIHLDMIASMTSNNNTRPRSSCNQRIPNNLNSMYESSVTHTLGTDGAGETQLPGGSLPDLTALQPHPHPAYRHHTHTHQHRNNSPGYTHHSPTSGGSLSPATGGLSPASGSPQGATVPLPSHDAQLYDSQNMSPIDHSWITSTYQSHQSHCSPPSQYSSTSNINIPSPTMLHSPGSPVEVPQSDYSNLHQALLQPFEQITMGDHPPSNSYTSSYINHSSPVSPQPNSPQTYSQQNSQRSSPGVTRCGDPVAGAGVLPPSLTSPTTPNTPASIPDIILTDYSSEFEAGIFGGEEAQLRAGLDLDELTLLEEPSSLLPDSSVEHEFQLEGT